MTAHCHHYLASMHMAVAVVLTVIRSVQLHPVKVVQQPFVTCHRSNEDANHKAVRYYHQCGPLGRSVLWP